MPGRVLTLSRLTPLSRRLLLAITLGIPLIVYLSFRDESTTPSEHAEPASTTAQQELPRTVGRTELHPTLTVRPVVPALDDSPLPEDEYLEQLRALNFTDKNAALTFAEKGEQWYSETGRSAEARRAMRITLLVDLDRMSEARTLTREFIAQYPESPYRKIVQGVTGIHPRPSAPRPKP